ncbi:MAG TPA: RHS repeat-associated core domain-containing protein [Thermodesulfobacteriota bacterium]|nr:RHS repeat-associated core domain-containing protein [Thermodesulfobacteriota bacterium]
MEKISSLTRTTLYFGDTCEIRGGVWTIHLFANTSRVASVLSSGQTQFYHPDHLGSASFITDQNGNAKEQIVYFPFGAYRAVGNVNGTYDYDANFPDVHYTFTDQEDDDDLGLYNYGARLYDPVIGKFISPDTTVPDPNNPQSLNRYSYALNNPLRYIDPTGNQYEEGDYDPFFWESSIYGSLGSFGSNWNSTNNLSYNASMPNFTINTPVVLNYVPQISQISLASNPTAFANMVTSPSFTVPSCVGGSLSYAEVEKLVYQNNLAISATNQLLICQISRESGFDWMAVGRPFPEPRTLETQVPVGFMQMTQIAARQVNYDYNFLMFPDYNIRAGSTYLQYEVNRAGGDVEKGLNYYSFWARGYASGILQCEACLVNYPSDYQRCLKIVEESRKW